MKKIIRFTAASLFIVFIAAIFAAMFLSESIPTKFFVAQGGKFDLNNDLISTRVEAAGNILDSVPCEDSGSYTVNLSLLGVLPIKEVSVDVVKSVRAAPMGNVFGVRMFTDGVLVIGMNDVETEEGPVNPAKEAGIRIGDIITEADGADINSADRLAKVIENCPGGLAKIKVLRDDEQIELTAKAARSKADGCYRLGAWVRDSTAGIGTMTFYLPDYNLYAGLGHGICDVDTGEVMPLLSGEVVPVEITGVVKGRQGSPGEIKGCFSRDEVIGRLIMNTDTGIYATGETSETGRTMEIAMKQDIKEGYAQIISQVGGSPEYYDIEIERVSINSSSPAKNMVIRITDDRLLSEAGGIIQGMSGSPIIQNGKLVGAVTHVFINDPTRGYGHFAENMLYTINGSNDKAA